MYINMFFFDAGFGSGVITIDYWEIPRDCWALLVFIKDYLAILSGVPRDLETIWLDENAMTSKRGRPPLLKCYFNRTWKGIKPFFPSPSIPLQNRWSDVLIICRIDLVFFFVFFWNFLCYTSSWNYGCDETLSGSKKRRLKLQIIALKNSPIFFPISPFFHFFFAIYDRRCGEESVIYYAPARFEIVLIGFLILQCGCSGLWKGRRLGLSIYRDSLTLLDFFDDTLGMIDARRREGGCSTRWQGFLRNAACFLWRLYPEDNGRSLYPKLRYSFVELLLGGKILWNDDSFEILLQFLFRLNCCQIGRV